MTKIEKLLISKKTVFSVDDLAVLWSMSERKKLWESIKYYLRIGKLTKVYSGTYVLNPDYSELELAVKLFYPTYISFHTALGIHGINFQHYQSIHSMALASKKIKVGQKTFVYHQLRDEVFFNETGVEKNNNYRLASPERAVCDSLYLAPSMTLDVLDEVNFDRLLRLVEIYKNKSLQKRVLELVEREKNA